MMFDSSRGNFQSIPEAQGLPDIEQSISPGPTIVGISSQQTDSKPIAEGSKQKVCIPRAANRSGPLAHVRTKHACKECQRRRMKCDGAQPVCQRCSRAGVECSYADRKHVRDKQQMKSLSATIDKYEHTLRDLLGEVPAGAAKRIKSILMVSSLMRLWQV